MNIKHPLKNAIIIILTAFIAILILILLGFWTGYISRSQERDNLRRAMEAVIETEGEKKLFEMAGISVDDIYYSDEGLELYQTDNSGAWKYTAEEARKIAVYSTSKDKVVQILGSAELSDSGQGSGVIVSQDGYIVTNKHVIGSGSSFTVNFYDGSTATADLVGYDELTDIAIIKINGKKNLPFIEFGSSSDLVVGDIVYLSAGEKAQAFSLLYKLLARLGNEGKEQSILTPAIRFMEENLYNERLKNSDIAAAMNVSEVWFRRLFKEKYGISPHAYLTSLRIERAKLLLSDGALTVTKIAEDCGFSGVYHFCKAFKDKTGLTPTEYRKSLMVLEL